MVQDNENSRREKHFLFFSKTHPETHQAGQPSQGYVALLHSKAKGLFARRAGRPNPSQPDPPLADVRHDSAQHMVQDDVAEELPNTNSNHPSVSYEVPHSDRNRNTAHGVPNRMFDDLMQQFQDRAARYTLVIVHWVLDRIQELREGADLSGMKCAKGVGLDTTKKCLPGTREEILDEITTWVNNTENDTPRVFWLHGSAGTGKSSIAHTIADRFQELGCLGSCYCFDRTQEDQRRRENVFTTIARGLADRDKQIRHALADIVHHDHSLTSTSDIMQQWKKLIVKPASKLSRATVGPILIVIEALDASGDSSSRRHLLQILAGKSDDDATHINKLPSNFRFLITSRTLVDIYNTLNDVEHIRHKTMDTIPPTTTERDVLQYITNELSREDDVKRLESLAEKAGGLFEWAHLACAYINADDIPGLSLNSRFEYILNYSTDDYVPLLDRTYRLTLESMFPPDQLQRKKNLTQFRSVMAQVLGTLEPLPLASLRSMSEYFPEEGKHFVNGVVKPMGAFLSGTTDPAVVRPLHPSFYDFLADKQRSGEFFVDTSRVHKNLAFASLAIMKHNLQYNTAGSYFSNSEIPDLHEQVKQYITPELSYSCRFWADHLQKADFDLDLADAVREFFNHEQLLLWLEVLSPINTTAESLSSVIEWVKPYPAECKDILDNAADAQRFIRLRCHFHQRSRSSSRSSQINFIRPTDYHGSLQVMEGTLMFDLRISTSFVVNHFSYHDTYEHLLTVTSLRDGDLLTMRVFYVGSCLVIGHTPINKLFSAKGKYG